MSYEIVNYEYEGNAEVCCNQCGEVYEIEFSGNSLEHKKPEDAITEALLELGWSNHCCAQCMEEKDEDYKENDSTEYDDSEEDE